jgi:hypothetical protein
MGVFAQAVVLSTDVAAQYGASIADAVVAEFASQFRVHTQDGHVTSVRAQRKEHISPHRQQSLQAAITTTTTASTPLRKL